MELSENIRHVYDFPLLCTLLCPYFSYRVFPHGRGGSYREGRLRRRGLRDQVRWPIYVGVVEVSSYFSSMSFIFLCMADDTCCLKARQGEPMFFLVLLP